MVGKATDQYLRRALVGGAHDCDLCVLCERGIVQVRMGEKCQWIAKMSCSRTTKLSRDWRGGEDDKV